MELILNFVWGLVAAAGLACWSLTHLRAKESQGRQFIALATLLLILFPVISITDDLWAAHNPAETDVLLRRYDEILHHQGIVPHTDLALPVGICLPVSAVAPGYVPIPQQAQR